VQLKAAIALIAAAAGGLTAGAPAQAPGAPRQATAEAPPQDAAGAPRQDIAGDAAPPFYTARFEKSPSAAQMSALGRALFRDPALSASGRIACATCHSPSHAFGPPDGAPVRRGGVDGRRPGVRTVPSLRYLQSVPPWSEHAFDEETGADQGPTGGLTWDGRAPSAHEQARVPLLSPYEMANASIGAVAAAVRRSAHAAQFRDAFGANIFGDPALAFQAVLLALETYQQDPAEFYPYSSKYDAWLRRQASLTDQELEGLAAFNDPARGNCARCHPSAVRDGAFPQFTDFGAIPRFRRMPTRGISTWVCAGRCARTSPRARNIAACSAHPPCATRRCGGCSSTTACCTGSRTSCASMPSVTPGRSDGIRGPRAAPSRSTTFRRGIGVIWSRRRPSAAAWAIRRRSGSAMSPRSSRS
jgi:cytochrome c peroxidase